MLEEYYIGQLKYCKKSGYEIYRDNNGEKYIRFTLPHIPRLGSVILKRLDEDYYVDVTTNRKYEILYKSCDAEKGNYYVSNVRRVDKYIKDLPLKDKFQIIKTIYLLEYTKKLGKLTNNEKNKTRNLLRGNHDNN